MPKNSIFAQTDCMDFSPGIDEIIDFYQNQE